MQLLKQLQDLLILCVDERLFAGAHSLLCRLCALPFLPTVIFLPRDAMMATCTSMDWPMANGRKYLMSSIILLMYDNRLNILITNRCY